MPFAGDVFGIDASRNAAVGPQSSVADDGDCRASVVRRTNVVSSERKPPETRHSGRNGAQQSEQDGLFMWPRVLVSSAERMTSKLLSVCRENPKRVLAVGLVAAMLLFAGCSGGGGGGGEGTTAGEGTAAAGGAAEETTAGGMMEEETEGGMMEETTEGGMMEEETTAGGMMEETTEGGMMEGTDMGTEMTTTGMAA